MKANTDGKSRDYYEYVLIYVDDVLAISHEPNVIMNALTKIYWRREPPKAPKRYLGPNIGEYEFADGGKAWYQSSDDYIKADVKNVDKELEDDGQPPLSKKTSCVLPKDYKPELDLTT